MNRRQDDNPELRHKRAGIIDHLICQFMWIKTLSVSGEIDRRCVDGIDKLVRLADSYGIQAELDEVRKRRIDPTN